MFRSVLIPLDGSRSSDAAVRQSIEFSRRLPFRLSGLGVIDEPGITKPQISGIGGDSFKDDRDQALLDDAGRRVHDFLDAFRQTCDSHQVEHEVRVMRGDPYKEVINEAERHDMIVIGRGTNLYFETRESPGRTVHRLTQDSPRPVVAMTDETTELTDDNHALICYDGSNAAARSLHMFALMALPFVSKVNIVTVSKHREQAERICARGEQFLADRDIDVSAYPVESTAQPFEVISAQIEMIRPSIIVMGAYGHAGLKEIFFGSTTRKFLDECRQPIFVYH